MHKGIKKQPTSRTFNTKKVRPDTNESNSLTILLQTIDGLSEDGKKRVLSYIFAKYEEYIPKNK